MTELLIVSYGGEDTAQESRRDVDHILDEVRATGGSVLRAPLSTEQEERLKTALDAAGLMAPASSSQSPEAMAAESLPSRPDLSSEQPGDPPIGTTPAALGTGTTPQT